MIFGFVGLVTAADLGDRYKATADQLIDAALADNDGYAKLAYLCDRIGARLSGMPSLDRALQWSQETMKRDGLSNVRVIPVKVPKWVRGAESAQMLAPENKPLHMLGLGMSVGTPRGGITADAVVVDDFDQLARLGADGVRGKIVVFNERWVNYGATGQYRRTGWARASALGAVAALVRSVTPLAMQIPHTGTIDEDASQAKIPTAALTIEDATMLGRFAARKIPIKIHLEMTAHMEPDADSGDVMGEIPGREHPEEVVVLGGHIDSWDVGRGAQDDGSGIIASLQAVALIKKLGLQPRRTIRVVFWVNEENGGRGGDAYRAWVGDAVKNHVAAIEMDGGAEAPLGFGYGSVAGHPSADRSMAMLRQIGGLLNRIGAGDISGGGGGSDIGPLTRDGVPALGERSADTHYFDWHHTETDTLDKVDPEEFRKSIAALAVMSYVLADMPEKLAGNR
jgi:hypothetical protein